MRSCCWLRRRFPLRTRRRRDRGNRGRSARHATLPVHSPMKTAIAIRHVHFEDLGSLEPALKRAGYKVRYADCCVDDIAALDPVAPDLVVVLGGPIGAYEDGYLSDLKDELNLLEMRLSANRPTIGICLGAQLMARALGARVYPSGVKEIGWGPIILRPAGCESAIRHLGQDDTAVLHWHGDTFDLPEGATLLASTEICPTRLFHGAATHSASSFIRRQPRRASSNGSSATHANSPAQNFPSQHFVQRPRATPRDWKFRRADVSTNGLPRSHDPSPVAPHTAKLTLRSA